uniref:FZ domain-containing protein n=1 Tax=Mesocestoides corti TaxID=53468 RepID=A0A5K3F5V6_MESCO
MVYFKYLLLGCLLFLDLRRVLGSDPDKLDAFFGITSPDEAPERQQKGTQTSVNSSASLLHPPQAPSEFIIYLDESRDVAVITCEVSLPSKDHSVHLLCPLVPNTSLCFENCRRVCSLPDCTDKPRLFLVECVEDLFVRDMYNIWKFRYIIDRRDVAVEGTWGCFHAGKSTETVNVTAALTTTTTELNRPGTTPTPHGRSGSLSPWLSSISGRLNSREMLKGKRDGEGDLPVATQPHDDPRNEEFKKTLITVLVISLVISVTVNLVCVFLSSCRKRRPKPEVRFCEIKQNVEQIPSPQSTLKTVHITSNGPRWDGVRSTAGRQHIQPYWHCEDRKRDASEQVVNLTPPSNSNDVFFRVHPKTVAAPSAAQALSSAHTCHYLMPQYKATTGHPSTSSSQPYKTVILQSVPLTADINDVDATNLLVTSSANALDYATLTQPGRGGGTNCVLFANTTSADFNADDVGQHDAASMCTEHNAFV